MIVASYKGRDSIYTEHPKKLHTVRTIIFAPFFRKNFFSTWNLINFDMVCYLLNALLIAGRKLMRDINIVPTTWPNLPVVRHPHLSRIFVSQQWQCHTCRRASGVIQVVRMVEYHERLLLRLHQNLWFNWWFNWSLHLPSFLVVAHGGTISARSDLLSSGAMMNPYDELNAGPNNSLNRTRSRNEDCSL